MDNDRSKEIEELVSGVFAGFSLSNDSSSELVDAFCEITPPVADQSYREITLFEAGHAGGKTIKPGNIVLNWRKLLEKLPELGLVANDLPQGGIIAFLAALYIWQNVLSLARIELSKNHAMVMYVMWTNRNRDNKLLEHVAFLKTREYLERINEESTWLAEFSQVIDDLVRIRCIELEEGVIALREQVRETWN